MSGRSDRKNCIRGWVVNQNLSWKAGLAMKASCMLGAFVAVLPSVQAEERQLEVGRQGILSRTGCYLVDYSYSEIESLNPSYPLDSRVYDVNRDKWVKEWIYSEEQSSEKLRLQHVLFVTDLGGKVRPGSFLKHQAEDWEYNAPFLYEFVSPSHWQVKNLNTAQGVWTRRVTGLDDGLRYQCAAAWREDTETPEWTCDNYSPIPGRETRDMGRKDYNTLQRSTRVIAYGQSWLERQVNVKTVHNPSTNEKVPLAREVGKIWYVRIPDSECLAAQSFVNERVAFWRLLQDTWSQVLTGDRDFVEFTPTGQPPRFAKIFELDDKYRTRDLSSPAVRNEAQGEILKLIRDYRKN